MIEDPFGWVGHTVGEKLKVEAIVAEGGFAVVYRALHLGFDERVALKCLKLPAKLEDGARADFLAAFTAEGKLLHRLSRSNVGIVQALDVGAATSPNGTWTPYLALEWLEGESLEDELTRRLQEGAPPRGLLEVIALLDTAANALAAAHEQGIVHRDIKPSNLFLTELGGRRITKVVDFGIAKVMSDAATTTRARLETGPGLSAFTPQHAAPEQFDRHYGATGPWTDVFALALVIVELLAGRAALDGGDTMQLYIAACKTTHRPTPRALGIEVSDAVEAVFARALAVEARQRHPDVGALWRDLVAAASGKAVVSGAVLANAEVELAPTALARPLAPTGATSPPIATGVAPTRGPSTTMPIVTRVSTSAPSPATSGEHAARQPVAPIGPPPAPGAPGERSSSLVPLLGGLLVVTLLGGGLVAWRLAESRPPTIPASSTPLASPSPIVSAPDVPNEPLPVTPVLDAGPLSELAPADVGFVDKHGGWDWGDRCFLHIKAGRLAWARAACERGLAMTQPNLDPSPEPSADPRGALLYNLGLIEEDRGNASKARVYFKRSLTVRPNNEVVKSALARVSRDH